MLVSGERNLRGRVPTIFLPKRAFAIPWPGEFERQTKAERIICSVEFVTNLIKSAVPCYAIRLGRADSGLLTDRVRSSKAQPNAPNFSRRPPCPANREPLAGIAPPRLAYRSATRVIVSSVYIVVGSQLFDALCLSGNTRCRQKKRKKTS